MNLTEHFHKARIPQRRYGHKFTSPKFQSCFSASAPAFPTAKMDAVKGKR